MRLNFDALELSFKLMKIPVKIPVESLVTGDLEANFSFAVRFYKFLKAGISKRSDFLGEYDAESARYFQDITLGPDPLEMPFEMSLPRIVKEFGKLKREADSMRGRIDQLKFYTELYRSVKVVPSAKVKLVFAPRVPKPRDSDS